MPVLAYCMFLHFDNKFDLIWFVCMLWWHGSCEAFTLVAGHDWGYTQVLRGGASDRRQDLHEQVTHGQGDRVDVARGRRPCAALPLLQDLPYSRLGYQPTTLYSTSRNKDTDTCVSLESRLVTRPQFWCRFRSADRTLRLGLKARISVSTSIWRPRSVSMA